MRSRRPRPRESSPKVKTSLCPLFWLHPQTPHLGCTPVSLSLSLSLFYSFCLSNTQSPSSTTCSSLSWSSASDPPQCFTFRHPGSSLSPGSSPSPLLPQVCPFCPSLCFPPTDLLFFFFFFFPRLCWRCLLDVCVSRCLLLCLRLLSFLMCEGQATLAHTHVRSHQSFCISCEYNIILFSERANTKSKHKEQTGQNINPRKEEKKKRRKRKKENKDPAPK